MKCTCLACLGGKKIRNIGNMIDIDCPCCLGTGETEEISLPIHNIKLTAEPAIEEIEDVTPLPSLSEPPKPESVLAQKLKKGFLSKDEKGKGKHK